MNYFLGLNYQGKNNPVMIVFLLFIFCVTSDYVCAQDTNTMHIQDNMGYVQNGKAPYLVEDSLELFLLEVQESYFYNHLMYCDDLEKITHLGETISPYWAHWVSENKTSFKIECDSFNIRLFYNDTLFVLYKHPVNLQEFSSYLHLWRFIRLFDEKDFVIPDTNIYEEYALQRREMLINLRDYYGYDIKMQALPFDTEKSQKGTYPIPILLIFDSGGLRPHPLFGEFEQYIDGEFRQQLVQLATSLCSKYKAKQVIFSTPVMKRIK